MKMLLLALSVLAAQSVGLTGNWSLTRSPFFDDRNGARFDCSFQQDRGRLSGTCGDDPFIGFVKGRVVTWQSVIHFDNHTATLHYEGELDKSGTAIRGQWQCPKHCENAANKTGSFILLR